MPKIELLAPARDFESARAAVLCGADAVYMGASRFGAREAAGNDMETIARVIELAHPYYVKVYAAVNTLLYDNELADARKLIETLYAAGIDGLIIQDAGLLEMDLPPVPLIASTQMDNSTPEKVRFLEQVGFSRVILARELSLRQIRRIRAETKVELECFVHGALCVGVSGRCLLSYAPGGRSGNRGQCAQPCRKAYTIFDMGGKTIAEDRYLLSLKDLNLSTHLESLIDAGVTSFKIEGRLKDAAYVANIVGFYRQELDRVIEKKGLAKASSGGVHLNFTPQPSKTFNRGFTEYAVGGKVSDAGATDTPKSIGEVVGAVEKVQRDSFVLNDDADLHNGDGLCFFDVQKNLCGTTVNRVEGRRVWPQKMDNIRAGQEIRRNYDHEFNKQLERPAERKIPLTLTLTETTEGIALQGRDTDDNTAVFEMKLAREPAQKPEQAAATIQTQLAKLGGTVFECERVEVKLAQMYFFPVSTLNALKRGLVDKMTEVRELNLPRLTGQGAVRNEIPYPEKSITYRGHVLNEKARAFFGRHGVEHIEPAAESGMDLSDQVVMTTSYCLRRQLGICPAGSEDAIAEPLLLEDAEGHLLRAEFTCGRCGMEIVWIR
ncbi:MAG: U32 family peptidase [Planctomycetaceae bacterium]|nr:U32 family peptidase [Planctomycetaceae bacterium]